MPSPATTRRSWPERYAMRKPLGDHSAFVTGRGASSDQRTLPRRSTRGEAALAPDDGEARVRRPRGARPRAEPPPLAARLDDPARAARGDQQPPGRRQPLADGRHAAGGRVRAQADGGPDPVGDRVARRAQRRDERDRRGGERDHDAAARPPLRAAGAARTPPRPAPAPARARPPRRARDRAAARRGAQAPSRSPSSSVSEPVERAPQARVDRAAGQLEHARDLARRVAEPVAQHDDGALVDRQRAQRHDDLLRPALRLAAPSPGPTRPAPPAAAGRARGRSRG